MTINDHAKMTRVMHHVGTALGLILAVIAILVLFPRLVGMLPAGDGGGLSIGVAVAMVLLVFLLKMFGEWATPKIFTTLVSPKCMDCGGRLVPSSPQSDGSWGTDRNQVRSTVQYRCQSCGASPWEPA